MSEITATPKRVYMRNDLDCMRAAIASALGIEYENTPALHAGPGVTGLWQSWQSWARPRGFELRMHEPDRLPFDSSVWVLGVSVPVAGDVRPHRVGRPELQSHNFHALVLAESEVWHDPLPNPDPEHLRLLREEARPAFGVTFEPTTAAAFDLAAGALSGKTADAGGTWAGAGDSTDYSVVSENWVERTATADVGTDTGRYVVVGTTSYTNTSAQVDLGLSSQEPDSGINNTLEMGVLLRYQGTGQHVKAVMTWTGSEWRVRVVSAGTGEIGSVPLGFRPGKRVWYTLRAAAFEDGTFSVWLGPRGSLPGLAILSGQSADLATGGWNDDGKVGIYDAYLGGDAQTRRYDNFQAFEPTPDAAIFAGRSLEFRAYGDDPVVREGSAGTYWGRPGESRGGRFWLPPAGDAGRTSRIAVMARRTDIETQPSEHIADGLSVQVRYRPRYVNPPRGD